jgi:hypothetical protein
MAWEVNRAAVFIFRIFASPSIAGFWPLLPHPACERVMTGPLFANRLEVVSNNRAVARRIWH